MKVLDLHCPQGHVFEGWFGSEADYQSQRERGLLQCPLCGSQSIEKRLSAPRLNLGAKPPKAAAAQSPGGLPAVPPSAPPATAASTSAAKRPTAAAAQAPALSPEAQRRLRDIQAAWLQASREIAAKTEDVGPHFAEQARQMHYGEAEERPIRGQATPAQTMELLEEGIPVLPLALPNTGGTEH